MKHLIDQTQMRELVRNHIDQAKRKNPLFSMRAFAKKIDISVGGLSSFLSGKNNYSLEMLEKIVNAIVVSPEERKDILKEYNLLFVDNLRRASKGSEHDFRLLKEEEIAFIQDWYHYALLFLIGTEGFRLDILWISKRLGISSTEVETALSRLVHLQLITISDDQTVTPTNNFVRTSDDVANQSLRIMHKQMLHLASQSIDNDPVRKRDITSLTLPVSVKNLSKAKEIIRKCQDDLMNVLTEKEKNDEVYHVLFCLYPVTKSEPLSE